MIGKGSEVRVVIPHLSRYGWLGTVAKMPEREPWVRVLFRDGTLGDYAPDALEEVREEAPDA